MIHPNFSSVAPQNNGGCTYTLGLDPATSAKPSPALGAGDKAIATAFGLTTDQRGTGFARVVNGSIDIGAFQTQTLAKTTTLLNPSVNPVTVGQSVTFTAVVIPPAGATLAPTGTVEFKDGSTVIDAAAMLRLVGGVYEATFTTSSLTLGSHTITAIYSGDTIFSTSTSMP